MTRFKPPRDETAWERDHPGPDSEPIDEPWDRRRRRIFRPGEWHRWVRSRRFGAFITILDGATDKPLDRRGLEWWHTVVITVVLIGVVAVLVARY